MKKSVWMGIGISNGYVSILKSLHERLDDKGYEKILFILADEIDEAYNNRKRKQLVEDLFNIASKITIKGAVIRVEKWSYISKKRKFSKILSKFKNLYKNNGDFKKRVNIIVKKNICFMASNELINRSNYVLGELAAINYFSSKEIVKIGLKKNEEIFDNLAHDFPIVKEIKTENFL